MTTWNSYLRALKSELKTIEAASTRWEKIMKQFGREHCKPEQATLKRRKDDVERLKTLIKVAEAKDVSPK